MTMTYVRAEYPAQLTIDGTSLTVVPSFRHPIAIEDVAAIWCDTCWRFTRPVLVPGTRWRHSQWNLTPCCVFVCESCDELKNYQCSACEWCADCCECVQCTGCFETCASLVCGECERCSFCECDCEDEDDDDYGHSCPYGHYVTAEGFIAQYGRHTDLRRFSHECRTGVLPEERGMGYVACWVAPDGAVLVCKAHYEFAESSYARPFAAGYVRITAQDGSYGCQTGIRRPTDHQLHTLASLRDLFCSDTRPMYYTSPYTASQGGKDNGRIEAGDDVRATLLNLIPPVRPSYAELVAAAPAMSYAGLYRNRRTPGRRNNGD